MTFNIRYDEPADGARAWPHRRALVIDTIRAHDPDLIGLQEPNADQFVEIAAALGDYTPFGLYRDEWGGVEPYGGFVRTDRFETLSDGLFWLSGTPEIAHSITWANDWGARACAWIRLRDRLSARDVVFASTHVDTNAGSWLPSAQVLDREITRVADATASVLVGDFNCPAHDEAHSYLLSTGGFRDAWLDAGNRDEGEVTYHGFTGATRLEHADAFPREAFERRNYRIDWILVRGDLTCSAAVIEVRQNAGAMPSDHYPVIATLDWR